MKNRKFLGFVLLTIVTFAVSCKSSNEKNDATIEAETTTATTDSLSDYAVLKAKTLSLVEANEIKIAAFKAKLANETAENKMKFQKEIDTLNAKNDKLKNTLSTYKEQGKAELKTLKERLQKSIDDINKDIDTYRENHK